MANQAGSSKQRDTSKTGKAAPTKAAQRASGNATSAAPDETYGLVSVLYHALQGAETYGEYIADAREAGAEELVEFFEQCQSEEKQRAVRAKQLLAMQLAGEVDEDDEDEDDDEDDEDDEDDDK